LSRSSSAFAVCVALLPLAAGAMPGARTARQLPAALSGVVQSADSSPQPIRRAVVTLTSGELALNISAISDDRGAFYFVNLAPGTYDVTASKAGYVTTALGARKPGQPGRRLAVAAGQRVSDLQLTLVRGAVVSGVLRDPSGGPAPNVNVTVIPATDGTGLGQYGSATSGSILTDDRGVYRAYGLAPGTYIVAATPRMPGPGSAARFASRLSGPTIDSVIRELQQRESGRATGAPPPAPPASGQPMTYAPVFYPGTPFIQDAERVRLAAGEVREGLDFALDFFAGVRLAGRIVMADASQLPRVNLTLTTVGPSLPSPSSLNAGLKQGADGSFEFVNVTPGRYVLTASATAGGVPTNVGGSVIVVSRALWGRSEVVVNGSDVAGVTLTMRPAFTISGRVIFERGTVKPPADFTTIGVGLLQADGGGVSVSGLPRTSLAPVRTDGTFRIGNVWPAVYRIVTTVANVSGWWLKSAMVNNRDILDFPLDMGLLNGDLDGVVLTFSDRHSSLSGLLQSASGQPATDHAVIAFPTDRALWGSSRRVRAQRPASDGRFTITDLPAGEYLIAVIADGDNAEWRQAALLEQAAADAIRVAVADGTAVRQDIRIR
jgi:hypothetical protein